MLQDERPGWKFICERFDLHADHQHFTGVLLASHALLGIVVRRNYPADDHLWPGRCGELGIVIAGRFIGFWNDPGY